MKFNLSVVPKQNCDRRLRIEKLPSTSNGSANCFAARRQCCFPGTCVDQQSSVELDKGRHRLPGSQSQRDTTTVV